MLLTIGGFISVSVTLDFILLVVDDNDDDDDDDDEVGF